MWLGKIPGHSGTQFKNRRAFTKANDFQKSLLAPTEIASSSIQLKTSSYSIAKWLQYISSIVFAFILIFFVIKLGSLFTFEVNQYTHEERLVLDDELRYDMYSLNLMKAQRALETSMIIEAQRLFTVADSFCPQEVDTMVGFMQTSKILCKELNQQCQLADQYLEYLVLVGIIDRETGEVF